MPLHEIKAEIPPQGVDAIDELLLELGVEGWSLLQDVIAQRAWIVGIFTDTAELQARWAELQPLLPVAASEPEIRALADQDWRDSYKAHFKAWQSGRLHWVPIWEKTSYVLPPGHAAIWLDPGLAFGTGNHETTRLCCERLTEIAARASNLGQVRVIDAGCGSGILALSAVALGFGPTAAFDNDAEAVRVSEENAVLNGAAGRVEFYVGDLITGLARRQTEVLLANIQADVLMRFAKELLVPVVPGGYLVLSGILAREQDQVRAAFAAAAPGWAIDGRVMGEWSDLQLTRPKA